MSVIVEDRRGRQIALRKLGVVEQLRLFKCLGADLAENKAYFGLARLAAMVSAIDDVPVPFPANEQGLEAILDRLDEDGVEAVGLAAAEMVRTDVLADAGN
jgi:hypothetical protein